MSAETFNDLMAAILLLAGFGVFVMVLLNAHDG